MGFQRRQRARQRLSLVLPEELAARLEELARIQQRSPAEVALDLLSAATTIPDQSPLGTDAPVPPPRGG